LWWNMKMMIIWWRSFSKYDYIALKKYYRSVDTMLEGASCLSGHPALLY
jgi:hypothetical protein